MTEAMIAPCGMNCALCSRHLAGIHNLKRSQCPGCRPRNEGCAYLFKKCTGINHSAKGDAAFCYECGQYPCEQIERIDKRYRKNYGMSMKDNLEYIREMGIRRFLDDQYEKHHCARCGGVISVHNGKCFQCDTINRLVDKNR
ncbi:DUF3795 domain-containing protein [bacterium]|nr:DUF3795 domain-containing protein [bacterium]